MGKQRPKHSMNDNPKSQEMLSIKPPIHRIAANSIAKNASMNKDLMKVPLKIAAARIQPNLIAPFVKQYGKDDIWSIGRMKPVIETGDQKAKLVLLKPSVSHENTETLTENARSFIKEHNISLIPHTLNLDYNFWNVDEILAATLPSDIGEVPRSYTVVGHIAHVNLDERHLPYKYHIGSVILSKSRRVGITTVVNKLDIIDSTYRNFAMEVIAGEENYQVTQSHLDCEFRFDFSKVYWNTRLGTEHRRLVDMFAEGEAVADVFAGVGPFAVPAGKKRVFVLANDLNPDSYESMEGNITTNKVEKFVKAFNEDGREFIRGSTNRMKEWSEKDKEVRIPAKKGRGGNITTPAQVYRIPSLVNHFVMNLPATAIEFLDAFCGLYQGQEGLFKPQTDKELPMIHVYCFQNPVEANEAIVGAVRKVLGFEIAACDLSIHDVRNVSPNKDMYCCSFRLPAEVAFAEP